MPADPRSGAGAVAASVVLTLVLTSGLSTAQVVRVSVATDGTQANAGSEAVALSDNGRFVLFDSPASNLVPGDTNGSIDAFVRDRDTDVDGVFDEGGAVSTTRVSIATGGAEADLDSRALELSADGRFVWFSSNATNLTSHAPTGSNRYRHDRLTSLTVLDPAATPPSAEALGCFGEFIFNPRARTVQFGQSSMSDVDASRCLAA